MKLHTKCNSILVVSSSSSVSAALRFYRERLLLTARIQRWSSRQGRAKQLVDAVCSMVLFRAKRPSQ